MRMFAEQQAMIGGMLPQSPIVFGTIVAVNAEEKLLKIVVEPWGVETGWCRVLKDTFYPIPPHATHAAHNEHVPSGPSHPHEPHTPHEPQWPYEVGQEVLAAAVMGSQGSEQYVVLGLLDS